MQLIYEGHDITDAVEVAGCVYHQHSGGRSDTLDLRLNRAADWYRWNPQRNDRIEVRMGALRSGTMYLNTMLPDEDGFRIVATGIPAGVQQRMWRSYEGQSLSGIMTACAAECGMISRLYGIDGGMSYEYVLREMEGVPAFLERLMRLEGAALTTFNGCFAGIGIAYAQALDAVHVLEIDADQSGVEYVARQAERLKSITVQTPFCRGVARDSGGDGGDRVITQLPASDHAQALRWARGLLISHNRKAERLTVRSEFNGGLTAMIRVDVHSGTDMAGKWLVDDVRHDLIGETSEISMLRCIETVG